MTFTGQNDMRLASALGCAELFGMPAVVLGDVGELELLQGSPSATVAPRVSWSSASVVAGPNVAGDLGSRGGSSEIG